VHAVSLAAVHGVHMPKDIDNYSLWANHVGRALIRAYFSKGDLGNACLEFWNCSLAAHPHSIVSGYCLEEIE
jgi:hypothetical protein